MNLNRERKRGCRACCFLRDETILMGATRGTALTPDLKRCNAIWRQSRVSRTNVRLSSIDSTLVVTSVPVHLVRLVDDHPKHLATCKAPRI
jgi:hypothetical protein